MKKLDQIAIQQYGIPSLILMENAGRGIADLAERVIPAKAGIYKYGSPTHFRRRTSSSSRKVLRALGAGVKEFGDDRRRKGKILIICGKGNNGGDGFVAARHLFNRGYRIQIVLLGPPQDLKDDAGTNFKILKKMKVPIKLITSENKTKLLGRLAQESDLIIDAIFGIGLTRPVTGIFYDVISILNASKKQILAIDVPSGLDSDSGEELGIAIQACATGTLAAAKRGLFLKAGPKCSGKIAVLDISIPKILLL